MTAYYYLAIATCLTILAALYRAAWLRREDRR